MDFLTDLRTFFDTSPCIFGIFAFFFFLPFIYGFVLKQRDNPQKYFKNKNCIDFSARALLFIMPLFFMVTDSYLIFNDIETSKDFFRFSVICQLAMSVVILVLDYFYDKRNEEKILELSKKIEELENLKNSD